MKASYLARRVTRPGGTSKRSVYMELELLGICCMIPHDDEMAPKHKKGSIKSFETLKNITKCRQNTRISAEQFRKTSLSIRMCF